MLKQLACTLAFAALLSSSSYAAEKNNDDAADKRQCPEQQKELIVNGKPINENQNSDNELEEGQSLISSACYSKGCNCQGTNDEKQSSGTDRRGHAA